MKEQHEEQPRKSGSEGGAGLSWIRLDESKRHGCGEFSSLRQMEGNPECRKGLISYQEIIIELGVSFIFC
jgi:hypothetical protein